MFLSSRLMDLQGKGAYKFWESEVMKDFNETVFRTQPGCYCTYELTMLTAYTKHVLVQCRQNLSWRRKDGHGVPPLAEELFAFDSI